MTHPRYRVWQKFTYYQEIVIIIDHGSIKYLNTFDTITAKAIFRSFTKRLVTQTVTLGDRYTAANECQQVNFSRVLFLDLILAPYLLRRTLLWLSAWLRRLN